MIYLLSCRNSKFLGISVIFGELIRKLYKINSKLSNSNANTFKKLNSNLQNPMSTTSKINFKINSDNSLKFSYKILKINSDNSSKFNSQFHQDLQNSIPNTPSKSPKPNLQHSTKTFKIPTKSNKLRIKSFANVYFIKTSYLHGKAAAKTE